MRLYSTRSSISGTCYAIKLFELVMQQFPSRNGGFDIRADENIEAWFFAQAHLP